MAQFDIHRNLDETTAERCEVMWNLVPELTADGTRHVLLVPQLTHVQAEQLGPVVRALDWSERHLMLSSVEMIFRGL